MQETLNIINKTALVLPSDFNFISFFIIFTLFLIFVVLCVPTKLELYIKLFTLFGIFKLFFISLIVYKIHFIKLKFDSLSLVTFSFNLILDKISFNIDSISLLLILLTTILVFFCLLISFNIHNFKFFSINFLVIQLILFLTWTTFDILFFYILFESVLIPMFIIIHVWGSRERKIRAAYLFFFYTVIGSLPMLLGILYIYLKTGTTNVYILQTVSYFSFNEQLILWLVFFIAFAVKVPVYPFHLWLPEAHVEAPTAGSVILAGVLLKLGSYAMIRFLNPLFKVASFFFIPLVSVLSIISIIVTSLTALRQNDLKRIIAYASIAHMNLIVIGIFSLSVYAVEGAVYQMISHGLVAGLLFFLIGLLYDRSKSRLVSYYSGLAIIMPTFSKYFLIAIIANMAFPGTSNFVGEFLLFIGIFLTNVNIGFLSALGIFLCSTYSIWLYNRIVYGNLNNNVSSFTDIDNLDVFIIRFFIFFIIGLGFFPSYITDFIYTDCLYIINLIKNG
jgi:proton-translocating NADH-quinone oxidoreductase chain M